MSNLDCETPGCAGIMFVTSADGVGRCRSCLLAYREGMAQVAEMSPQTVDSCLDALAKLLGPREERDRPRRVEVEAREMLKGRSTEGLTITIVHHDEPYDDYDPREPD
jgi:hypothetical protein